MGGFIDPEPLAISALILNLVLGVILSVFVACFYARYGEALSNRLRFAHLVPMPRHITILIIFGARRTNKLSIDYHSAEYMSSSTSTRRQIWLSHPFASLRQNV